MTRAWWADLWASPMAPEYDDSDRHGLLMLAALVDDLWRAKTARDRLAAAAEVRLQGARYGLSPIDRRRLQWGSNLHIFLRILALTSCVASPEGVVSNM